MQVEGMVSAQVLADDEEYKDVSRLLWQKHKHDSAACLAAAFLAAAWQHRHMAEGPLQEAGARAQQLA